MHQSCPSCHSTKVKKNGKTHYGKQNHRCKACGRQFVAGSEHIKGEGVRRLVARCLKERLSLRAVSRVFGVSLKWVVDYSRELWQQTPDDLGVTDEVAVGISESQVFGIQLDEMWSFVKRRADKRWIWVAYDPVKRLVVACHFGDRSTDSAGKLWGKIPQAVKGANFETDDWEAYKSVIPEQQHKVGKDLTYYIEGFMATIRARVSRLVRKALSFSKKEQWHDKAIAWFFWQFNLERQPYI